jgi:hypothetical protein
MDGRSILEEHGDGACSTVCHRFDVILSHFCNISVAIPFLSVKDASWMF